MHRCCGGQQAIHSREWAYGAQASPFGSDIGSNWQDSIRIRLLCMIQPLFQSCRLGRVGRADLFDASADFPQHQHTQEKFTLIDGLKPFQNLRIGALPFPGLAENDRVQQIAGHKFTLRPKSWFRSNRSSGPPSGIRKRCSLKDGLLAAFPIRAWRRMRRCSSSIDTPCRPACALSLFTTLSSICLTISCAILKSCYQ